MTKNRLNYNQKVLAGYSSQPTTSPFQDEAYARSQVIRVDPYTSANREIKENDRLIGDALALIHHNQAATHAKPADDGFREPVPQFQGDSHTKVLQNSLSPYMIRKYSSHEVPNPYVTTAKPVSFQNIVMPSKETSRGSPFPSETNVEYYQTHQHHYTTIPAQAVYSQQTIPVSYPVSHPESTFNPQIRLADRQRVDPQGGPSSVSWVNAPTPFEQRYQQTVTYPVAQAMSSTRVVPGIQASLPTQAYQKTIGPNGQPILKRLN